MDLVKHLRDAYSRSTPGEWLAKRLHFGEKHWLTVIYAKGEAENVEICTLRHNRDDELFIELTHDYVPKLLDLVDEMAEALHAVDGGSSRYDGFETYQVLPDAIEKVGAVVSKLKGTQAMPSNTCALCDEPVLSVQEMTCDDCGKRTCEECGRTTEELAQSGHTLNARKEKWQCNECEFGSSGVSEAQ